MTVEKVCLVCLSDNYDHQTGVYSLFDELKNDERLFTIGRKKPKAAAPDGDRNLFVECPGRPGITKGTFDFRALARLLKLIRHHEFSTLYFETVHLWNIPICLAVKGKTKIVITIHDVEPHGDAVGVLPIQRLLCRLADKVVIKSASMKNRAKELYGISENDLLVVPLSHRFPEYDPPVSSGIALFFGRIKQYKGVSFLPDICKESPQIRFVIAGVPDENVKEDIEKLRLLDNVEMRLEQIEPEAMDQLFHQADWVILPYESASQSGVVIDSYERSRPVIAFGVGALPEQICDGLTGFVIAPGDTKSFSACLNDLHSKGAEVLMSYSKNAFEYGYAHFSSQANSEQFRELFLDGCVWS